MISVATISVSDLNTALTAVWIRGKANVSGTVLTGLTYYSCGLLDQTNATSEANRNELQHKLPGFLPIDMSAVIHTHTCVCVCAHVPRTYQFSVWKLMWKKFHFKFVEIRNKMSLSTNDLFCATVCKRVYFTHCDQSQPCNEKIPVSSIYHRYQRLVTKRYSTRVPIQYKDDILPVKEIPLWR